MISEVIRSFQAIMMGYFNFSDAQSAAAYETYLNMALRNFEADPFGQVGFAVFLRPDLAEKYFLTSSNVISLVLFNEIHTAKWTGSHLNSGKLVVALLPLFCGLLLCSCNTMMSFDSRF
jgi:hypothetical protein